MTLKLFIGTCLLLSMCCNHAQAFLTTSTNPNRNCIFSSLDAYKADQDDKQVSSTIEGAPSSRRQILSTMGSGAFFLTTTLTARPEASHAFDNKISNKYDDRPKRRGPQPKDLGVRTRKDMVGEEYAGLKNCGSAPNCFCSTDDAQDDPEHNIPSWHWPKEYSITDDANALQRAFRDLEEAVQAYIPGRGDIDGGGFQIVQFDAKRGYLYAQFESLKAGYIDDVEFAVIDGFGGGGDDGDKDARRAVQVRSSSRVGYLDYGVNAKRLNYLAEALRGKGWDAPGVDFESHRDYAIQNEVL